MNLLAAFTTKRLFTHKLVLSQQACYSSYLSHISQRFKQLDIVSNCEPDTPENYHVQVPFEAKNLDVQVQLSQTLNELTEKLKQTSESVKNVSYYTLDGAHIPQNEILENRNNIPFIMNINGTHGYALNLNANFSIVHNFEDTQRNSEEAYLTYCQGIGLPRYTSFLLANFANKFHSSLPNSEKVPSEEILKSLYKTMSYYRSVSSRHMFHKVSDLQRLVDEREDELIKLKNQQNTLIKKANFRANTLLVLGSSILLGQFAFIMGGTFVYFSWDVMEPLAYMMLFSNFTFAFFFYTLVKKDLELSSMKDILTNRFLNRLYRKKGFDVDRLEYLENEINMLREQMNKSIF